MDEFVNNILVSNKRWHSEYNPLLICLKYSVPIQNF